MDDYEGNKLQDRQRVDRLSDGNTEEEQNRAQPEEVQRNTEITPCTGKNSPPIGLQVEVEHTRRGGHDRKKNEDRDSSQHRKCEVCDQKMVCGEIRVPKTFGHRGRICEGTGQAQSGRLPEGFKIHGKGWGAVED